MCGICGVFEPGQPPDTATTLRMREAIAHRGPDGAGIFEADGIALGHRRLAIIDLSDGGIQPFASDDGTLQLLHNGEIYNYRELQKELESRGHRFRTATDTEVLLAAYREWGERCVERFNGMWAFALWDALQQKLFCSRDRFGVKPFYYRYDGRRFVFASELKAFRHDPRLALSPNLRAVRSYVEQGYLDHTSETFFSGISSLAAAHSLVVDTSGATLTRYWDVSRREPPDDPTAAFRELFVDAVRLRLRSDVPLGTALSGGLDSSAIACTIDHLLRNEQSATAAVGSSQRTFTAYFADTGFDERPYARAVAESCEVKPYWISFTSADLIDTLPAIVEAQEEPFGSTSIVAQWYVMRAAAGAGVKVMLDGQGGDEILAGYPVYWSSRFADLLTAGRLAELRREVRAYRSVQGVSTTSAVSALVRPFLGAALKEGIRSRVSGGRRLLGPALRDVTVETVIDGGSYDDRLRRKLYRILTRQGLPELLRYEDRNSMAHSIESRVPFLDYRLVELAFSLDGAELLGGGMTKNLLRSALRDILPPLVRERTDKLGFVTPGGRFFREQLGLLADEVFASRSFAERGFLDVGAVQRRLAKHRAGQIEAGFELWRALNLELWARTYLDP